MLQSRVMVLPQALTSSRPASWTQRMKSPWPCSSMVLAGLRAWRGGLAAAAGCSGFKLQQQQAPASVSPHLPSRQLRSTWRRARTIARQSTCSSCSWEEVPAAGAAPSCWVQSARPGPQLGWGLPPCDHGACSLAPTCSGSSPADAASLTAEAPIMLEELTE
jgi:hypothetical protein